MPYRFAASGPHDRPGPYFLSSSDVISRAPVLLPSFSTRTSPQYSYGGKGGKSGSGGSYGGKGGKSGGGDDDGAFFFPPYPLSLSLGILTLSLQHDFASSAFFRILPAPSTETDAPSWGWGYPSAPWSGGWNGWGGHWSAPGDDDYSYGGKGGKSGGGGGSGSWGFDDDGDSHSHHHGHWIPMVSGSRPGPCSTSRCNLFFI